MTRIDRRRRGRHARDRATAPQTAAESPIAGSAIDAERTSFTVPDAFVDPPSTPADAPSARTRSSAGVVGQVNPGEVIAARTAVAMLADALRRHGLHAEGSGQAMLSIWRPGGDDGERARRTVLLGHHPHDSGRLWWWLWTADSVRRAPDGAWRSFWPAQHAIGPVDEAAKVASRIAGMLPADAD